MRWEQLFADLEARFEAAAEAELGAEVADRIRSETARTGLAERIAAATGSELRVVALGGATATGTVRRTGPDWFLLGGLPGVEVLVPLTGLATVSGLPRGVGRPGGGAVGARLGLGSVLRGIARDRLPVVVDLVDGTTAGGVVERVGRDHLELSEGPGEPSPDSRGRQPLSGGGRGGHGGHGGRVVPTAAIAVLRRR